MKRTSYSEPDNPEWGGYLFFARKALRDVLGAAHMKIYLIRHAHALDGKDDAARPLSKKGRGQIRTMARFLRRSGALATREFWHSPMVRAVDTARLLAQRLEGRARLTPVAGLLHEDKPAIMARRLNKLRRPVAVVGHEPHLSALASLLIAGRPKPPLVVLRKCAVLALERHGRRWQVRWQVSPGMLGD
jgi:phosphohistidine phosphatase